MPWIIITANGEELDRLILTGPLVLGRSPECDLPVRDILLSRTHCRIEPVGNGYKVVDLNSKNGTHVGWQKIKSHNLREGDWLRMGRTRITFHTGEFEPAPEKVCKPGKIVRPADPHEALSGTVTDFVLLEEELPTDRNIDVGPFPQPHALDPTFGCADARNLLEELAGHAATLVLDQPRTQTVARPLPRVLRKPIYREIRHTASEGKIALSLQVEQKHFSTRLAPMPMKTSWKTRAMLSVGILAGTGIVMMSLWLLTISP